MTSKMQSCVDHIKTALDVDPWAQEMVERIFTEYDRRFDEVLEIIDKVSHKAGVKWQLWTVEQTMEVLRCDILALIGGERNEIA